MKGYSQLLQTESGQVIQCYVNKRHDSHLPSFKK